MISLNILSGNINSCFRGNNTKFDKNLLNNYDICLFSDARISSERLKILKSKFNLLEKPNQFFTCLCRSIGPKHGCLIFINSKKILKVIECNNQFFVHSEPRICYVVSEIEGWGLIAIIIAYFPANGGIEKKIKIYEILIRIIKRL